MATRAPAFFQSTAGLIRSRLHLQKPRTLRDLMQSDIVCSATAGARCTMQKHSSLAIFPSSVLLCFGAVQAHTLQLNMLQRNVACAWSTSAQRFSSVDCKQQTRAVHAAMNGMAECTCPCTALQTPARSRPCCRRANGARGRGRAACCTSRCSSAPPSRPSDSARCSPAI